MPTPAHIATLHVSEPGFCGLIGSVTLSPLTLLIGANAAGKTRIARAVQAGTLGVSGRPAAYGTQSDSIAPPRVFLSDPPDGTAIDLTLSTGAIVSRLISTGQGSRAETERADRDADELIGRRLIDVATLASSTEGQARTAIAACLTRGGLSAGWTVAEAVAHTEAHMVAGRPDDDALRTAWLAPLHQLHRDMPRNPTTGAEDDGGGWMTACLPLAEKRQKDRNLAKSVADKALKAMHKAPPVAPPEDRAKAKADRDRAVAALHAAQTSTEAAARYQSALAAWTTERDRLADEVARITTEGKARKEALAVLQAAPLPEFEAHLLAELQGAQEAPQPEPEPVAGLYTQAVADARAAMDAPIPGPDAMEIAVIEGDIAAADTKIARLAGDVAELDKLREEARIEWAAAEVAKAEAVADRDSVAATIQQLRADLAAVDKLHTGGACKTCSDTDPYGLEGQAEDLREQLANYAPDLTGAEDALAEASISLDAAAAKARRAVTDHGHAAEALAAVRSTAAVHRAALARLTDPAQAERIRAAQTAAWHAALHALDKQSARLAAEYDRARVEHASIIAAAERAIARRRESIAAARAAEIRDAEAALARLRSSVAATMAAQTAHGQPPPEPSAAPVDTAQIEADIARCAAIERAWTLYDAAHAALVAAEQEAETAKLHHAAAECFTQSLRLAIEDLGRLAVAPIQAAMDAVIADIPGGIPGGSCAYYAGPSDYGVITAAGVRVRLPQCSGAESLLATVALEVALAKIQGCPIPLCVIDEIRRVQPDLIGDVLRAVAAALARGDVGQVLVTMPIRDDETADDLLSLLGEVPGMRVIHVVAKMPAAALTGAPASPAVSAGEQSDLPF